MTFQRTFQIEELREQGDRFVMRVGGPSAAPLRTPVRMTFLLAKDQFKQVRADSPVILSMIEPGTSIVCFEGKVTARAKGDQFYAFDFQVGPDGQKQFGTLDIDEGAYLVLTVGTRLYLYVPQPAGDYRVTIGGAGAANVASGTLKAEGLTASQLTAATTGAPHHWRFELTLDDAATVPFQQLCRLGLLIGRSGGEIADGQVVTDAEMTTMLVRGPGIAPPDALFVWCKDNGVTCAVRADA